MTLYDVIKKDSNKFKVLKKFKIFIIKSTSRMDRLMAEMEEYYLSDIPYRLLRKKVFKVYHYENTVEVFE